jgi:hypothetical protein
MATKEQKEERKNWEIIFPSPLILDPSISDEAVIAEVAEASSENEISQIYSNALEGPHESYNVSCTRSELFDSLRTSEKDISIEVVEYDDMYIILIRDGQNNVIGRGEIYEGSVRIKVETLKKRFSESLVGFTEKFMDGQKRMNNLAYKLKSIQSGIQSGSKDSN